MTDQLEYSYLENDPLSSEMKKKILEFATPYLKAALHIPQLTLRNTLASKRPPRTDENKKLEFCFNEQLRSATLGTERTAQHYHEVLLHPECHSSELGIDPQNYKQVYAAQILLQAVMKAKVKLPPESGNEEFMPSLSWGASDQIPNPYYVPPLTDEIILRASLEQYKRELCEVDTGQGLNSNRIAGKHLLLFRNDPIQALSSGKPTPLDTVLAHTHFQTGKWVETNAGEKIEHKQDRKRYRALIKQVFSILSKDIRTQPIIEAFAAACEKEGGNILISGDPFSTSTLGTRFNASEPGTCGFYARDNAVVTSGLVNLADEKIFDENVGTLAHEMLHYIFDLIHNNNSSPISYNDSESSALLDAAIHNDKLARKGLNPASHQEEMALLTVVDDLEKDPSYWGSDAEKNATTMRAEIIIRPMEQIAKAVVREHLKPQSREAREEAIRKTIEAVHKVQPNVLAFYNEKCVPELRRYTQQRNSITPSEIRASLDGSGRKHG